MTRTKTAALTSILVAAFALAMGLAVATIVNMPETHPGMAGTQTPATTTESVTIQMPSAGIVRITTAGMTRISPGSGFGMINPAVTQANIGETICVSGWTATVRPPTSYTEKLKLKLLALGGLSAADAKDYELDHFIPLELGGAPSNPQNLWLEKWDTPAPDLGAHAKDRVENYLKRRVCAGTMTLAEAQREISTNWVAVLNTLK